MSCQRFLSSKIVLIITSLAIAVATDSRAVAVEDHTMWGDKFPSKKSLRFVDEYYHDLTGAELRNELYSVREAIYSSAGVRPPFPPLYYAGATGYDEAIAVTNNGKWEIHVGRGLDLSQPAKGKLYRYLVMAHEIGHHLLRHTGTSLNLELQADWFAGCALGIKGDPLKDVIWLYKKHYKKGSRTHPPLKKRIEQVKQGWSHGRRRYDSQSPCSPSNVPNMG
jgi:hypothetical protein